MDGVRYAFNVSWFDPLADLKRYYQLFYWVEEKCDQIEMFDVKLGKRFLKKMPYPTVQLKDLFLGNRVEMYVRLTDSPARLARQLLVESYGDEITENRLSRRLHHILTYISQDAYNAMGSIVSLAEDSGYTVAHLRMLFLSPKEAQSLAGERRALFSFFRDAVVALEVVGERSTREWSDLLSDRLSSLSVSSSAVHVCGSEDRATEDSEFSHDHQQLFAERAGKSSASLESCSLALIKPHILLDGLLGKVLSSILETGFLISGMELLHLNRETLNEFFDVYKGVLPDYGVMIDTMTNGPCVALEIRAEEAVQVFREFCGPVDVDIAKVLAPKSLRALYGNNNIENVLHCTDLEEDGVLEVSFFFETLLGLTAPRAIDTRSRPPRHWHSRMADIPTEVEAGVRQLFQRFGVRQGDGLVVDEKGYLSVILYLDLLDDDFTFIDANIAFIQTKENDVVSQIQLYSDSALRAAPHPVATDEEIAVRLLGEIIRAISDDSSFLSFSNSTYDSIMNYHEPVVLYDPEDALSRVFRNYDHGTGWMSLREFLRFCSRCGFVPDSLRRDAAEILFQETKEPRERMITLSQLDRILRRIGAKLYSRLSHPAQYRLVMERVASAQHFEK